MVVTVSLTFFKYLEFYAVYIVCIQQTFIKGLHALTEILSVSIQTAASW